MAGRMHTLGTSNPLDLYESSSSGCWQRLFAKQLFLIQSSLIFGRTGSGICIFVAATGCVDCVKLLEHARSSFVGLDVCPCPAG